MAGSSQVLVGEDVDAHRVVVDRAAGGPARVARVPVHVQVEVAVAGCAPGDVLPPAYAVGAGGREDDAGVGAHGNGLRVVDRVLHLGPRIAVERADGVRL